MSTYIISDIHGEEKKFHRMLKKLNIDLSVDVLIIDGDILDRGQDSLKLFYEILQMRQEYGNDHVIIIKGNHEYFLSAFLKGNLPKSVYSSQGYGGADTIREVEELSEDEKKKLIEIIDSLPLYKTVFSEKRQEEIIVTHTGVHYEYIITNANGTINVIKSIETAAEKDEFRFLINGYLQRESPYSVIKSLDKTMIIGHVPTPFIADIEAPIITQLKGGKVILIDCGAGHGEKLGCLRLEDEAVFCE